MTVAERRVGYREGARKISYRGHFEVEVAGDPREIASVVLLRSDHNTHSLTTGDRYVKLAFRAKARRRRGRVAGQGAETARAGGSGHLHALRSWTGTACRAWADGLISSRKPAGATKATTTTTSSNQLANLLKRGERHAQLNTSLLAGLAVTSLIYAEAVGADDERHRVRATLSGFQETPSTLSTPGSGRFTAKIDDDAQTIDYKLSFEGLEAPAIAAHIHLGARATSGGVSAFLCSGGNKPPCPPGAAP